MCNLEISLPGDISLDFLCPLLKCLTITLCFPEELCCKILIVYYNELDENLIGCAWLVHGWRTSMENQKVLRRVVLVGGTVGDTPSSESVLQHDFRRHCAVRGAAMWMRW